MNPTLAALYGTGMDKLASEEEDYDFSDFSDEELLLLADEMDDDGEFYDEDFEGEDVIEKMASAGEVEYWDMAGRIMAHAYADEFDKVASAEDYDEFDEFDGLAYVDADDFDAGDIYDLAMEKEASIRSMYRAAGGVLGAGAGRAAGTLASLPPRLVTKPTRMLAGGAAALAKNRYNSRSARAARALTMRGGRAGAAAARRAAASPTGQALMAGARAQGPAAARALGRTAMAPASAGVAALGRALNISPAQVSRTAKRAKKMGLSAVMSSPGGKAFKRVRARNKAGRAFKGMMSRVPAIRRMSDAKAGKLVYQLAGGAGATALVGGGAYGASRG